MMGVGAAMCHATLFVAILPGLDRFIVVKMRPNARLGTIYDPTPAIAGRLPRGVTSAMLYPVESPDRPISAEVDHGAYYAERLSQGLYILRITGSAAIVSHSSPSILRIRSVTP